MRSYALGAGPITYQSYDDRNKKEDDEGTSGGDAAETENKKTNENSDKSLTDLRHAFEYTKVEYSMANSHFRAALKMAIQLNTSSAGTNSAQVPSELTDATMEKLLLEMSTDERINTLAQTFSYLLGAEIQLK